MTATKTVFTGLSMATILFGGVIFLYMNLANIAKPITERLASEALGVPVSIAQMDIDIPEKRVSVSGLRVANPAGYGKKYAMTTGDITVELGDLSKELIVFNKIAITDTDVNLEVNEKGTNLNDIKKGISSKAPKSAEKPANDNGETASSSAQAKPGDNTKVIIKHFALNDAQLNPSVVLFEQQDLNPVTVPDIQLTGVGQKENGILAREAIAQIADYVFKKFNQASGSAGFLNGLSSDALKDMGQAQIDVVKDQIKDEVKNIGNQLKGLFGN